SSPRPVLRVIRAFLNAERNRHVAEIVCESSLSMPGQARIRQRNAKHCRALLFALASTRGPIYGVMVLFRRSKIETDRRNGDGYKTGGRQAGTPNKATVELQQKLAALGCDPIIEMATIAENPAHAVEIRLRAYSEIAQYVYPKRRAVEVGGDVDAGVQ